MFVGSTMLTYIRTNCNFNLFSSQKSPSEKSSSLDLDLSAVGLSAVGLSAVGTGRHRQAQAGVLRVPMLGRMNAKSEIRNPKSFKLGLLRASERG